MPDFLEVLNEFFIIISPFLILIAISISIREIWKSFGRQRFYSYKIKKILPKVNYINGFTANWTIRIGHRKDILFSQYFTKHNPFIFNWNKNLKVEAIITENYTLERRENCIITYFYDFEYKCIVCAFSTYNNCQTCKNNENEWLNRMLNKKCEAFKVRFRDELDAKVKSATYF